MLKQLPAAFLCLALCGAFATSAADEPAPAATAVTKEAVKDAESRAAAETGAAIGALGANPGTRQISSIVFKAVRSSPASVLAIVDAAVRVSPQAAAPEIVTAAVAAIPNPWKQIVYRRLSAAAKKSRSGIDGGPDGKGTVNLAARSPDFKGAPDARGPSEADGRTMTLAEAIARTAFDAQPGLSLAALQTAVDVALLTDPATLIRRIQSATSLSGVGDAGTSNYANEPLRRPNPPVVSQ